MQAAALQAMQLSVLSEDATLDLTTWLSSESTEMPGNAYGAALTSGCSLEPILVRKQAHVSQAGRVSSVSLRSPILDYSYWQIAPHKK